MGGRVEVEVNESECRPFGTRFIFLLLTQHLRAGLMNAAASRLGSVLRLLYLSYENLVGGWNLSRFGGSSRLCI
jgi:hypothetical protein